MTSFLLINNKKLHYSDIGKGSAIIFLHGYLESLGIWNDFALGLSKKHRVICFDIPGHGQSECLSEKQSVDEIARFTKLALTKLNVDKCIMIGHSMGGYITLAYHKLFSKSLLGFCLFHSHPFADTEETKKKRLREIKMINNGKKELIAKFNIPNAFAKQNLEKLDNEIQNVISIALETPKEGIISNLHAMMNRDDLSESLANSNLPFLYIAGKKDNYIDFERVVPNIKLPIKSELCVLKNSGHMGFIEEKDLALKKVVEFIKTINDQV